MKQTSIYMLGVAMTIGLPFARAADEPKAAPQAQAAKPAVSEAEAKRAEELFEAGRKLFFQANYAAAAEKLKVAADANPAKVGYRMLLAKAYRRSGGDAKATALLEEILRADPEHVEAGVELSEMLSVAKQPDQVIAILTPLLKYKHDYP